MSGGEQCVQRGFKILLPSEQSRMKRAEDAWTVGKQNFAGAEDLSEKDAVGFGEIDDVNRPAGNEGDLV